MMKNYVDAMADALVDVLKYSDSSVEWPDIDDLQYDEAIKPEWFYPALQSEGESELTRIGKCGACGKVFCDGKPKGSYLRLAFAAACCCCSFTISS